MRRLALLALLLLVGLPAASFAETCTSLSSGFRWTAVGTTVPATQWGGCTPTLDDNFTLAAGHLVFVDGTVTITTGSISAGAGHLWVLPASTLNPGEFLACGDGSSCTIRGTLLASCRIRNEPNWTAADPVLTLTCAAATLAGTSDYLVGAEEDPTRGNFTRKTVVVGPGVGGPGTYKTSPNRYAWYDITAVSGNTVTIDLDAGTYVASPDAPYQGTRGNDTTTAIGAVLLSYTVQPGRRATLVTVALAYGSVVAMNADRGEGYLYFVENPANAANPAYCSGKIAKILHSENGGLGDDLLYVAGDVSGCTLADARIIPGFRRGDLVHLVRPATVDGIVTATHTGHIRVETGATLNWRWARFPRLGAMVNTEITPNLSRHCNICLYQSSTSPGGTITGRIMDVDIAFPEANATGDTGVLEFSGLASSLLDYRYPNTGLLDLRGLTVERVHVHDGRNEGTASGTHGIYLDGVKNLLIDGARVARTSDDLFGAAVAGNSTGTATDANKFTARRILAYEGIAEDNNSQQGIEPTIVDDNTPAGHNYVRQLRAINVEDSIAVGTYFEAFSTNGHGGAQFRGIVSGGSFLADGRRPGFNFQTTDTTLGIPMTQANVTRIRDSLLTSYSEDGTTAVPSDLLTARIENSVVWGDEQSADAGNQIQGLQGCYRSLIFHGGAGSTNFVLEGAGGAENAFNALREFNDCAIVNAATSTRLAQSYNTGSVAHTINFRRFLYLQTAGWEVGANGGPLGAITVASGATVNVNGAVFSTATAGTKDFDLNTSPAATASTICYESNNAAATDFQTYAAATNLSIPDIFPDAAAAPSLGLLVGNPKSTDVCERARPEKLGLSRVGASIALLGDFVLEELYPIYTSRPNLIRLVGGGAAGQTPPVGIPGH